MDKHRITLSFSGKSIATLDALTDIRNELKNQNKTVTWLQTIEHILEENKLLHGRLDERVVQENIVKEQLETIIRPVKLRSGYADKNVRILLELFNGLLYKYDIEDLISSDLILTEPVKQATEKISSDINSTIKRNLEKKGMNEAKAHE